MSRTLSLKHTADLMGISPALVAEFRQLLGQINSGKGLQDNLHVNVRDYGAIPNDNNDDLAAFNAAVAALAASPTQGGVIIIPAGTYDLSGLWNLSVLTQVVVRGAGLAATYLKTAVTATEGIRATSGLNKASVIQDLALWQFDGAIPSAARSGNYGIATPAEGTGYGLILNRVDVRYFGKDAVYIQGPTGPTLIRDCYLYACAGYGVNMVAAGANSPQNVTVRGGAIQDTWGGIHANAAGALNITDVDIELPTTGQYPPVYLESVSGGVVENVTAANTSTATTPAACIAVAAATGVVISGGITANSAAAAIHNLLFDTGGSHNAVVGGHHYNTANNGYFAQFTGGTNVAFVQPNVVTATYSAGYDLVNDAVANYVSAWGVKTASRASSADACKLPTDTYVENVYQTQYTEFVERADPAAPGSNKARLYAKDNGAGKTQLVVLFPTGAVQVLATEP